MVDLDEQAVKAALASIRKMRQPYADILKRPQFRSSAALAKQRRFVDSHLNRLLDEVGLGPEERKDLRIESESELRRLAERRKAEVLKRSASASKTIRASLDTWRQSVEHRGPIVRALPPPIYLSEPFIIYSQSGDIDVIATKSPWNNVAKASAEWSKAPHGFGYSDVSFIFVWGNSSDSYVFLDVYTNLGLNGFGWVTAYGSFWADNWTCMWGNVQLNPYVYKPELIPPFQSSQLVYVMDVCVNGGTLFTWGNQVEQAVAGTYYLSYSGFPLPPHSTALFDVRLQVYGYCDDDGSADIDFRDGNWEIVCPGVVLIPV